MGFGEISTLAMIYSALLILILRPASRRGRRVRIVRSCGNRTGGSHQAGSRRAGLPAVAVPRQRIENGKTRHGCRGAHEKILYVPPYICLGRLSLFR